MILQGGCSSDVAQRKNLALPDSLRGPFLEAISTVYPGRLDSANRFLPAVSLNTAEKGQDGANCSGVLLSPRMVLTAGHCVCLRRDVSSEDRPKIKAAVERAFASQPDQAKADMVRKILGEADSIIDGSRCARLSMVRVTRYSRDKGGEPIGDENADVSDTEDKYKGQTIRPHDNLVLLYEGNRNIFRDSDLAIVVLNRPVAGFVPAVKLPRTAVQRGESVVMVGYGLGRTEQSSTTFGDRHVAGSKIVEILGSDSPDVEFAVREEPGDGGIPSGTYPGDSGGPCFSKSNRNVLLGIASAMTTEDEREKLSIFTSVYPVRDWVRRVAREVGETVH